VLGDGFSISAPKEAEKTLREFWKAPLNPWTSSSLSGRMKPGVPVTCSCWYQWTRAGRYTCEPCLRNPSA
jgi:hypothetical protein